MGVSSRIAPIFSFHIFFVNLRLVNIKKQRIMETNELQRQLDAENLNFLNYILGNVFDVELQGYVYSEDD